MTALPLDHTRQKRTYHLQNGQKQTGQGYGEKINSDNFDENTFRKQTSVRVKLEKLNAVNRVL